MEKKIKKECEGQILSNGNIPKLVVANLTPDMYQYAIKMGFGHIFEDVEEAKPAKRKSYKKKK